MPVPQRTEIGVSRSLAVERATRVADVSAELTLFIPQDVGAGVSGTVAYHLVLKHADAPLVVDFAPDHDFAPTLEVNGRDCRAVTVNGHLVIGPDALKPGNNAIVIGFKAGGAGLHRTDELLYSLFVPARASLVFPCFDQPDIKVRWTVSLDVPAGWEAVSNGRPMSRLESGGRDRLTFSATPPLPTYLLAFAAGRFRVETADVDGRRFRVFHRESETRFAACRSTILERHRSALDWLEDWTTIDYPFDSFDIVLIPSFQFGGMEHPGAIYYRSDLLVLDDSATAARRLARDHVIAHETAHIWFGDFVTMRWFDDVWLKEVMANVMADKILATWHPGEPHDLRFLIQHFPAAYAVDRTPGARAIRQPLENLNEAASLYGPTIYLKAPIAFRTLERAMGDACFRAAMRTLLDRYPFGNAGWPELLTCLSEQTSMDLASWSQAWIETPGRPTLHVADETGAEPASRLPDGGLAYGDIVLDDTLQEALARTAPTIADPVRRAAAYLVLWDAMLGHRLPPARLFDVLLRGLDIESQALTRQLLLDQTREVFWRFTPPQARASAAARLEAVLMAGLNRSTDPADKATWLLALSGVALTDSATGWLEEVWRRERLLENLTLSDDDETQLALDLAVRRPVAADAIAREQHVRLADAERRERLTFLMPALSTDAAARATFADSLTNPGPHRKESWVVDAIRLLHHPLREPASIPLVVPALSRTRTVHRTGDIFFPQRWVNAVLAGHQSPAVAHDVRIFLDTLPPDYPARLRDVLLVAADPLFRAARWLEAEGH